MKITEASLYEALGVEAPAAPAEDPKPAETQTPAQQPVTQPQTEPSAGNVTPAQPESNAAQGAGDGQELTLQQRHENAARRRQQELEQVRADERAKMEAEQKEFFMKAGLKNSYTGAPITNMEEFRAWNEAHNAQQMQRDLQAGKLTPEMLQQAISQHPVVQQAQQLVAQQAQQAAAQAQAAERAQMEAELQKIYAIDPLVKTPEDLLNLPTAEAFKAYVDKGYSFEDAHYLANRERLEAAKADAIRQQALNDVRSKSHLTPDGNSRGNGAVAVPADQMAMFRLLNPTASEAEIIAYYNKHLNQ